MMCMLRRMHNGPQAQPPGATKESDSELYDSMGGWCELTESPGGCGPHPGNCPGPQAMHSTGRLHRGPVRRGLRGRRRARPGGATRRAAPSGAPCEAGESCCRRAGWVSAVLVLRDCFPHGSVLLLLRSDANQCRIVHICDPSRGSWFLDPGPSEGAARSSRHASVALLLGNCRESQTNPIGKGQA